MPAQNHLDPAAEWSELVVTDADWDAASPQLLTSMLSQLVLIRTFEEFVLELAGEGLIHGPAHSSIGQEGGAVGSCIGLTTQDTVNGSHRGHHQFLAKVLTHVHPEGIDPTKPYPDDVREVLLRTLREICGLDRGFSHGRGGSMHLQWHEAGAIGTNAIVGGGVPLAAGSAWSHKNADTDAVAVTYFGDGATNIGSTLETLNLAGAWSLPLCFFMENNQYAVSTHVSEVTAEPRLSGRGPGFGIRSWKVDGMDPLAVYLTTQAALEHMRSGKGPTVIEADVYRYFHQNGPFAGSAFRYRSKEEEAEWRGRDPLDTTARHLVRRGILTQDDVDDSIARAKALMAEFGDELLEPKPNGKPRERQIKAAEWPNPTFVDEGIRGDLSELSDLTFSDVEDFEGRLEDVKFIDAVAGVMGRRLATDDRIVIMGEDIHRLNGGTNGATRGLKEAYPDRVLGTPISRERVHRPRRRHGDGRTVPTGRGVHVRRLHVGRRRPALQPGRQGPAHVRRRGQGPLRAAQQGRHGHRLRIPALDGPRGIFATAPGWRIVAPSTPFDYVGLMNTALACDDPVVVLEHVDLYGSTGPGVPDEYDHYLPVGKAAVRREGKAITILTYGAMTKPVLDAVAEVGVDAEVIDLRWLDRASLDWDTVSSEHPEDQQRADRRAGRRRNVVRRMAGGRDPAPAVRLARRPDRAGDRRRGLSQHQQGAGARCLRAHRRGRHQAAADRGGVTCPRSCGCPRLPPTPPRPSWPTGTSS